MTVEPTIKTPASAIVGAVLAGISLILALFWPVAIPAGAAAVIIAHRSSTTTPRPLRLATLIVGYIGLTLATFWLVVYVTNLINA